MPRGTRFSDMSYHFNVCTCNYQCQRYHRPANGTKTCNIFRKDVNGGIESDRYVNRHGSAETGALSLPCHKNQEMHT